MYLNWPKSPETGEETLVVVVISGPFPKSILIGGEKGV